MFKEKITAAVFAWLKKFCDMILPIQTIVMLAALIAARKQSGVLFSILAGGAARIGFEHS